jgi:transcriptional regulator with XRE-family HTH domain
VIAATQCSTVDEVAIGRLLRVLRIRLRWRAVDVATKAGVSASAYSQIERGQLGAVTLDKLRRVAGVLEVRLVLEPRWRGAEVARLLSSRHAAMSEIVARVLVDAGWQVRPEVSFNHFGERGVVDLLAWHEPTGTILIVELKTELADVNGLLATMDRRRRLGAVIAAPFGWEPRVVAAWVVLGSSRTNERRVAQHRTVLRAAFPSDGRAISGWLSRPTGPFAALSFLPNSGGTARGRTLGPTMRVRRLRER